MNKCALTALAAGMAFVTASPASAQAEDTAANSPPRTSGTAPTPESDRKTGANPLLEEIVVTATKRLDTAQNVPLAITAFNADQLEASNFRGLGSLSTTMPNVGLDDAGSLKGYANFTIRGLGLAGTIPSIDPTVGVFVDGIYQGINSGVVLDNFDIEAIEVLRGPQGVLFGRNVTGGAVLIRTTKPTDELHVNAHAAVETGTRYTADFVATGPLVTDRLSAKIAAYYSHDDGYFRNDFDGRPVGKDEQFIVRGALRWTPTEALEVIVRADHGTAKGDGAATQNHAIYGRDSREFNQNYNGGVDTKYTSVTAEANLDVAIGEGTITNIFGYRKFDDTSGVDSDSGPTTQLHFRFGTDQRQFSNEFRYNGRFGNIELTTGLYYFDQDLFYIEERTLALGTVIRTGGGYGYSKVFGAFLAADWHLSDTFTVNAGLRYNDEKKSANTGVIRAGGGDFDAGTFLVDHSGKESWNNLSPRIGFQFKPAYETQIYGYYARGFRSGGYNFRQTIAGISPLPFDPEVQDSFELGWKQRALNNRLRFTADIFHNIIDDIQRDVQIPDVATSQIVQRLLNAGRMRVQGFEFEGQFAVTPKFVVSAQVGYTDAKYKKLTADLSGDGVINAIDYNLKLPRLARWTYGISATYDYELGSSGTLSARVGFNHRDKSYSTDNNLGKLDSRNLLDAKLAYSPPGDRITIGVYGSNLLNDSYTLSDFTLPDVAAFGGDGAAGPRPLPTFSPLAKGRVIGGEVRYKF